MTIRLLTALEILSQLIRVKFDSLYMKYLTAHSGLGWATGGGGSNADMGKGSSLFHTRSDQHSGPPSLL